MRAGIRPKRDESTLTLTLTLTLPPNPDNINVITSKELGIMYGYWHEHAQKRNEHPVTMPTVSFYSNSVPLPVLSRSAAAG